MKNTHHLNKWKITASLCMALLAFGSSAIATVTVTFDNQNGSAPFTPTWTPAIDSLIAGLTPSLTQGDFNQGTGANFAALTAGGSLTVPAGYPTACGDGAGNLLVYTLPASANGYDITNITTYSGWNDSGRDGQGYTLYYSTVNAPGVWIAVPGVSFRNDGPSVGQPSCNRVTINDSLGGTIATNVYAVMFDFGNPGVENGWVGMGAITVEGTPAANSVVASVISTTGSVQSGSNPFTPSWTAETPDLLLGLSPSTAVGGFNNESTVGTAVLTDGAVGISGSNSTMASCGNGGGNVLVYTLTNSVNGSDVTNIVVYSGWQDNGRYGQYYILSYSTVSTPSTFIPLTTVYYLPSTSGTPACRVAVNTSTGVPLAQNVFRVKLDFASPPEANRFNNGWQGYSEIIVQGTNSAPPAAPPSPALVQDILPTTANNIVGDQVVLTAAFSASPPTSLQWQQVVSGPATNNVSSGVVNVTNSGVITSTLTLNNVQLSAAGSYQVMAVNATNGAATPTYSSICSLAVSNVPAAVGNAVVEYAGQTAASVSSYSPPLECINAQFKFDLPPIPERPERP